MVEQPPRRKALQDFLRLQYPHLVRVDVRAGLVEMAVAPRVLKLIILEIFYILIIYRYMFRGIVKLRVINNSR